MVCITRCSGFLPAVDDSDPSREAIGASLLPSSTKASFSCRFFLPLVAHEVWSVLTTPFNPLARDRSGLRGCHGLAEHLSFLSFRTSGSLDKPTPLLRPLLTSAIRSPSLTTEPVSIPGQERRSPEVSFTVFHAQPPNLRFAPLMDLDFAVTCQLVRRSRLISGFSPSARVFAPRFFQTCASRPRPCASLILHLHQAG